MNWAASGGALATLLLVGLLVRAWHRARRPGRIDTPEDAMREAGAALGGFDPVSAVVAEDGAAALVVGRGGRVAVLSSRTRRIAAREIAWEGLRATPGGIVVEAEGRFGPIALPGVDALHVRQLIGAEA